MVDTYRGVVRVRKWPRKRKATNEKSAKIVAANEWFKEAAWLAKYVPAEDQILSKLAAKGSAQYPRDFLTAAMAGTLLEGIDLADGTTLSRVAESPLNYPPAPPAPSNQPATDPYWSSVKLLVGTDAINGTPTIADLSPSARTLTAVSVCAADRSEAKNYDGSVYLGGGADYLRAPDSTDWNIANNEALTLELWVRFASLNDTTGGHGLVAHYQTTGNQRSWAFYHRRPAMMLTFLWSTNGLNPGAAGLIEESWTPVIDKWYHVAITRDTSNVFRLFINGNKKQTKTIAGACFNSTETLTMGTLGTGAGGLFWLHGWLTGIRYTKGVCRWTDDFDPPNARYPVS